MKRAIKTGDRVKTADGTIGTVRYVGPKYDPDTRTYGTEAYAELSPEDAEGSIVLPVAELRRVPSSTRPPIEDMPPERPRCPFCARALRPVVDGQDAAGKSAWGPRVTRRVFVRWNGYPIARGNDVDKFCTLTCARAFANAAFLAGYRIKKGGR